MFIRNSVDLLWLLLWQRKCLCNSIVSHLSDKGMNVKKLYCKHEVSLFLVMSANWNLAMSCSTGGHCPERRPWLVLVLPSEWLSTSMMLCICWCSISTKVWALLQNKDQSEIISKYTRKHPWIYYISSPWNYKVLSHIFVITELFTFVFCDSLYLTLCNI